MSFVHPKDRLETANPKCFNCKFWRQHSRTWGECTDPDNAVVVNEATMMNVTKMRMTADLGLCSSWRDIDA